MLHLKRGTRHVGNPAEFVKCVLDPHQVGQVVRRAVHVLADQLDGQLLHTALT